MQAQQNYTTLSQLVDEDAGGYLLNMEFGLEDYTSLGLSELATVEPLWSKFALCLHLDDSYMGYQSLASTTCGVTQSYDGTEKLNLDFSEEGGYR